MSQTCTDDSGLPDDSANFDPFVSSDERYGKALKFPLERANAITEIEIDFNHIDTQVKMAEIDFENAYGYCTVCTNCIEHVNR